MLQSNKPSLKCVRTLKSSNYATLVSKSIEICSKIIGQTMEKDSGVTIQQKCNALLVLSVLSEPSAFLSLAAEFSYPYVEFVWVGMDIVGENSEDEPKIMQTFAKSFVNVTIPHLTFPYIQKFLVNDYFKHVIDPLYTQTFQASQAKSLKFLSQHLLNTQEKLQKLIIQQYFKISTMKDRIRILNELHSSSVSIRYEIFLQAMKCFRLNPSQRTWTILKEITERASVDDVSIVKCISEIHVQYWCPADFISDFVEAAITILRKFQPSEINSFICELGLEYMFDKIAGKTLDFIILPTSADVVDFDCSLCAKYLESSSTTSVLAHRLSNIKILLRHVIANGWDLKEPSNGSRFYYPTRQSVSYFVSKLCEKPMNDSPEAWLKKQMFQTLTDEFKSEYTTKLFKETLELELSLLIVKDVEKPLIEKLKSFGNSLAILTDALVKTYGGEIVFIVKKVANECVQNWFSNEIKSNEGVIVELVDAILETSKTRQNKVVSIALLDHFVPEAINVMPNLGKFVAILNDSDDVTVQIFYNSSSLV